MSGSVVVDASLAIKWLVEEDDSDKAHAVLQSWVAQDITRIAPHLMPFEVANALHRRVLRGEQKWLRKSEQGDKWNRCLIEGMIVLSETGARDEQTTPP